MWALLTGGITGGIWVAIVLLNRQRRLATEHAELLEDRQRTLDELEQLQARLRELEDRVDFAERLIAATPTAERLPSRSSHTPQ